MVSARLVPLRGTLKVSTSWNSWMISALVWKPSARSSIETGCLRLRSMCTYRMSLMSVLNSTHEPRYGMIRARNSLRPFGWNSSLKNTPARTGAADDHPLGAVDDEGPLLGDAGQLAEVDLLLLDVADLQLRLGARFLVLDDEAQAHLQRHGEGETPSWHSSIPYFGSPVA